MGVGLRQLGHRRLVRQPTGAYKQHAFIQRAGEPTNRLAEQASALEARQRRSDAVNKHRQYRDLIQSAEQKLQRLSKAVIDLHVVRHGKIDAAFHHRVGAGFREIRRHRQFSRRAAKITDRRGANA
ncbi:hypothetical protein D3C73_1177090 [compost metagenome]